MIDNDFYFNLESPINKFLDEENRMKKLLSSAVYDAYADMHKFDNQFYSSVFNSVIPDIKQAHEQVLSAAFKIITPDIKEAYEQALSAASKIITPDIKHAHEYVYFAALSSIVDIQKSQEKLSASILNSAQSNAQWAIQGLLRSTAALDGFIGPRWRQDLSTSILSAVEGAKLTPDNIALSLLDQLRDIANDLKFVDISIQTDGSITGQDVIYKYNEVQTLIESFLETTPEADKIGIEKFIDKVLKTIAEKHPIIAKVFVHILLQLVLSAFSATYLSPPVQVQVDYVLLAKQLKKETRKIEINKEFYDHYRFVSSPAIDVWSKNAQRSRYIGKLYFGCLVSIIQKNKNWSLVEYHSEDGDVTIQGWVLTRYIKRFD